MALVPLASADEGVPDTGWGFGIADDNGGENLKPAEFQGLGAKIYRLQIPWDAAWARPVPLPGNGKDQKGCIDENVDNQCDNLTAQFRATIEDAESKGVQNVAVTIKGNNWEIFSNHGSGGVACSAVAEEFGVDDCFPSVPKYRYGLTKTVLALRDLVDVWGPANEPNAGMVWLPENQNGPAMAASYYNSLRQILVDHEGYEKDPPGALLMSPDFHDRANFQSIKDYLTKYWNAGGRFGNVIAFHPYNSANDPITGSQPCKVRWAVHDLNKVVKELRTGNPHSFPADQCDKVVKNGSEFPVWLTELGGYLKRNSEVVDINTQNKRVTRIVNQLGTMNNVHRIYYYNVKNKPEPATHDTGLLAPDGTKRPAYTTWCVAASCPAYGASPASNPPPPPPPPQSNYMGIASENGSVWLKYGLPGGQWLLMGGLEFNARDVELDAGKMAVIDSFGGVWLKNGLPGSTWQLMFGPEFDARDVEISGNRIAVLHGNGSVWIKDGLPGGPIHWIGGGVGWGKDIELEGERLAVASHDGSVLLKTQLPWGAWHMIFGPEFETKEVEVSGEHVAIIHNNGSIWLKEGLPGGPIHLLGGLEFAGKDIELDAGRLALLHGNGSVWLKNGLPGSTWEVMFGLEFAAKDIEISGNRLALIHGNGSTWMKEGLPGGPIYLMGGLELAARDLALW